jgi:hypothetical protein
MHSHDDYIVIRKTSAGVEWQGARQYSRGHMIPREGAERPDGVFAEWTWDGRELLIRNDRYGVASLFYCPLKDGIVASPSLLTLLAHGASPEIDEPALAVFLRLGFFVGDDTPFRAIRTAPPAGTVRWTEDGLTVEGDYARPRAIAVSREQALDAYIELFRQAMQRRLPTDDRAVIPLSGGRGSRQILFELCAQGRPPRCAVTIPRYPPRPHEDERVAPLVAEAAGVPHVLLRQNPSRASAELAKNWQTHLCADEHAWFMRMIDALTRVTTVYDGMAGASSSRFLSREVLELFDRGRMGELAERLLDSYSIYDEHFIRSAVGRRYRAGISRDQAATRLVAELARHVGAADPVRSFNFWNRIRRELALVPFALMRHVRTVYAPYLDFDLWDFLMALAPTVIAPGLNGVDKSFHSEAICRAYPQYAHVPFEDKKAPRIDSSEHDASYAAGAARIVLSNLRVPPHLLNQRYVWPRLALAAVSSSYARSHRWLPTLALYLFQVDAAAAGLTDTLTRRQRRPTASSTPDVIALARPPARLPA